MDSTLVHFFDNDDAGYSLWLGKHPHAFVANMTRTKTPKYFKVHRTSCKTITPGSSRNNHPGAFTAGSYRKAAATSLLELVAWANQQGFDADAAQACRRCLRGVSIPTGAGRLYPDEVPVSQGRLVEGAIRQIVVNSFERSAAARERCIRAHGTRCAVCDLDMYARYGEIGRGFIHVHHLVELATIGAEYEVDPVKDLRPVCPNCHAMLHRTLPALSIEAVRSHLGRTSAGWAAPRRSSEAFDAIETLVHAHDRGDEMLVRMRGTDGGTEGLFSRLHRAAMNQVEAGPSTASRYAIWANTCRDHIAAGLEAVSTGEHRRARELLILAANSLLGFAAVQAKVDSLVDG